MLSFANSYQIKGLIGGSLIVGAMLLLYACEPESQSSSSPAPQYILIEKKSVDGIYLGMAWEKFIQKSIQKYTLKELPNDAFLLDGGGTGMLVSKGDEKMYYVYKKFPDSLHIGGIIILSDRCRTKEGVYIGMPLADLANQFTDFTIRPHHTPPPEEVFLPLKYQTFKGKHPETIFTIGIQSADNKLLGKYKEDGEYIESGTDEYRLEGNVATIEMHRF